MSDDDKVIHLADRAWMTPDWQPTHEAMTTEWVRRHGERFRYSDDGGQWFMWDAAQWRPDTLRAFGQSIGAMLRDIGEKKKRAPRDKIESNRSYTAIGRRARDECAIEITDFDCDEHLNTAAGELELGGE